jgi:hypothetical protein
MIEWFIGICVFNVILPFVLLYKIKPFLVWVLDIKSRLPNYCDK